MKVKKYRISEAIVLINTKIGGYVSSPSPLDALMKNGFFTKRHNLRSMANTREGRSAISFSANILKSSNKEKVFDDVYLQLAIYKRAVPEEIATYLYNDVKLNNQR